MENEKILSNEELLAITAGFRPSEEDFVVVNMPVLKYGARPIIEPVQALYAVRPTKPEISPFYAIRPNK